MVERIFGIPSTVISDATEKILKRGFARPRDTEAIQQNIDIGAVLCELPWLSKRIPQGTEAGKLLERRFCTAAVSPEREFTIETGVVQVFWISP